ncbi:hypothetical protein [Facklamia sp. P9177]|uniref:hypothetical protein n=1 Tax=Facklamia sp. P9177 TaxID=3421945 RepID=UPI003D1731C6
MPFIKDVEYQGKVNFLKSAHVVAFTQTATKAMDKKGKGVIPAGTVFPANDGTAIGILYNDVDVSAGDQPCSVIVEGYILKDRLPVEPTAEAIAAMKEIKFY